MSIFYSQSDKPRDFTYQNTKVNAPLELKGTSKRSNAPQDSLRLSTEPTYHATSSNMGPDTRRTINPQYNKENVDRPSSRNLQGSNNYHPGSLMNLFDKTLNDGDRYDRMRKNKAYDVSKESNVDQPTKRHLKPVPLKDLYDYKTGISTLPITDQIREEKQTKVVRNYTNAYIKEKYDLTSAISTLPGTFNQRNDRLTTPVSSKKHSEMALKNLINTESSNRKAEVSRKPIEPNTSNRNAISNSTLDQASQINPLARPKRTSDAREKLYSQSKEEYFGLRDNPQRQKPLGAQNVFKSSIELR